MFTIFFIIALLAIGFSELIPVFSPQLIALAKFFLSSVVYPVARRCLGLMASISRPIFYLLKPVSIACVFASSGTCCCILCGGIYDLLWEIYVGMAAGAFVALVRVAEKQIAATKVGRVYDILGGLYHHRREVLFGAIGGYLFGIALHIVHHFLH